MSNYKKIMFDKGIMQKEVLDKVRHTDPRVDKSLLSKIVNDVCLPTINGIPFVCTSRLAPFATVEAGKPYMVYGKMKGYELAHFTALEVAKSTDYKFKEGVIAFKVTGFVGGSPAMWNGFASVQKAAGTTNPVG